MGAAGVPGLALAVVQGDEVVYARGFGVTSVEDGGLPVTAQTLFRIGSTTKPLTGTAVMRLVEAGQLDLDRPVRDRLDWFALSEPGAERVTLRMLMSHTAGLPTAAEHVGARDPDGLEAYLRREIASLPLVAPPGRVWSYSNPGISLVGHLAEVAAGKPYAELMRELVFDPLEMGRTTFDPTVAMTFPLAQSHDRAEDGTLSVQHRFADNTGHYPAGFAISTVLDLANFALMQMNGGSFRGRRVLSPESVAEMQRRQARLYTADDQGYGLTFGLGDYKGVRYVAHGGAISTFGSWFQMLPEHRLAVVALFNRLSPEFKLEAIVESIYDQLLGQPAERPRPPTVEPDRARWPRYVGIYVGQWAGLARIEAADDGLVLELNGERMPLDPLAPDLYVHRKSADETVSVGFADEEYVMLNGSPARRSAIDDSFSPDPARLDAYAGTYHWENVDRLVVRVEEGRLLVRSRFLKDEVACVPLGESRFACRLGVLEFESDPDGVVKRLRRGPTFVLTRGPE
jgi:CubicO group peptidase (beta-lactamase class C family)